MILHRERPGLWPIWAWLALTAAGFAALAASGDSDHGYGLLMASGVVGLSAVVPLVFSRRRYSAVTVTSNELRVGTETFALRDIGAGLLERQREGTFDSPSRFSMDLGGGVAVAGGAWGPTLGQRHLLMEVEGRSEIAAVPTRDPRTLARVLLEASGPG